MGGAYALGGAGALGRTGLLDEPFDFLKRGGSRRFFRKPSLFMFFCWGSLNRTEKCDKEHQADEEFYLHFCDEKCE